MRHLIDKVEAVRANKRQAPDQDLVTSLDDPPRFYRSDDRCSQWQAAYSGVCTENMVGHKLGEFSLTRTFKGHTAGKKAKK